jgi:hypothetical protein
MKDLLSAVQSVQLRRVVVGAGGGNPQSRVTTAVGPAAGGDLGSVLRHAMATRFRGVNHAAAAGRKAAGSVASGSSPGSWSQSSDGDDNDMEDTDSINCSHIQSPAGRTIASVTTRSSRLSGLYVANRRRASMLRKELAATGDSAATASVSSPARRSVGQVPLGAVALPVASKSALSTASASAQQLHQAQRIADAAAAAIAASAHPAMLLPATPAPARALQVSFSDADTFHSPATYTPDATPVLAKRTPAPAPAPAPPVAATTMLMSPSRTNLPKAAPPLQESSENATAGPPAMAAPRSLLMGITGFNKAKLRKAEPVRTDATASAPLGASKASNAAKPAAFNPMADISKVQLKRTGARLA